jgi:hypothetical protein
MNRLTVLASLAACALPLTLPAEEKTSTDHTGCDNVNWSKEVLDAFPNAKRGCQRVTVRGDKVYVQYAGEVVANTKDGITVHLKDHDGKNMTNAMFLPTEDKIKVNDRIIMLKDVEKGTTLHFYLPHNRWGLYADPEGEALKVISFEPM